jgi:hypothetical protein
VVKPDAPAQGSPRRDPPRESDRFLRPQPPAVVPPRTPPAPVPGLLAHALLGARVCK